MTTKKTQADGADIQQELADLRTMFDKLVAEEEEQLTADQKLDKQVERFAELYNDPYDEHDALRIKKHLPPTKDAPEGWKLGWKSPRVREMRGWRGWVPCKWNDSFFMGPNGESILGEYTNLGKDHMDKADTTDSIIRVKDLMLCRIDARIATARALKHIVDSHRARKLSGAASPEGADTKISRSIGEGMEDDSPGRQLERLTGMNLSVPDSKFEKVNKE